MVPDEASIVVQKPRGHRPCGPWTSAVAMLGFMWILCVCVFLVFHDWQLRLDAPLVGNLHNFQHPFLHWFLHRAWDELFGKLELKEYAISYEGLQVTQVDSKRGLQMPYNDMPVAWSDPYPWGLLLIWPVTWEVIYARLASANPNSIHDSPGLSWEKFLP